MFYPAPVNRHQGRWVVSKGLVPMNSSLKFTAKEIPNREAGIPRLTLPEKGALRVS